MLYSDSHRIGESNNFRRKNKGTIRAIENTNYYFSAKKLLQSIFQNDYSKMTTYKIPPNLEAVLFTLN